MKPELDTLIAAAFRAGMRHAISDYATWKDGEQYVGALMRPIATVLRGLEQVHDGAFTGFALLDPRVVEALAKIECVACSLSSIDNPMGAGMKHTCGR